MTFTHANIEFKVCSPEAKQILSNGFSGHSHFPLFSSPSCSYIVFHPEKQQKKDSFYMRNEAIWLVHEDVYRPQ